MDSCHNKNLPYTKTAFSSFTLSKSIAAKKSRWISPSPKRKTMTQMIASKKNEVKNNGTSNTKSLDRNSLKRKSSFAISDINNKIKRLEALHEETTTSDSDTTITKIDRLSKKKQFSKPIDESSDSEDLCKTLKSVNNTANQLTLLHPFSREEDIKIIQYFHKFMELLAHKDDIYVYQLMEMKYHFQRSAKFLQDRFLNEILPNLYVYDYLSLAEMVVFYDRADMLVPKHVQNLIEEKVRSITGHCISSAESVVITVSDSDNETITSACSSNSSPIILKRKHRVIPLSSSPSICSTNTSENALETAHNSHKDSCIHSEVLSVVSSVTEDQNSAIMCDDANNESVETCQLVNDSDLGTGVNLCEENKYQRNVKDSDNEHSDNVDRNEEVENITTNMCDTAEGRSDCASSSACLFETSETQIKYAKSDKMQHEKLVSLTNFTKTVENSNCNTGKVTKSSQMIQNDQSHDNFTLQTDHTYVKLTQIVDKSLDNMSVQRIPDNTSSISSETADVDKECISLESPDMTAETSSRDQQIQHVVKSISKRSFMDTSTNTEPPGTTNKRTQLSSLESNNTDSIICLDRDAIELRMNGNSNIYVSKRANVKKIAKQHEILENSIHLTDSKNMEILQLYTNYKSNINTAIKTLTETNMEENSSRYNLRKFVRNPRGGTCTRRNINWCNPGDCDVFEHLTKNFPSKEIMKSTNPSRRSEELNKIFSNRQLELGESKIRKKINKALLSPASDQSDETESSATSSAISDTSTTSKFGNKISQKLSSGIVIRKTYLKNFNKSELDSQSNKSSPINEKFHQSAATVTSVSSKPVCSGSGSDNPAITEINTNTSDAMLTNDANSHISDARMCETPESDIQINTISPSRTEKSNDSLSTVTFTPVTNQFPEDSNPESDIFSIQNNFENRVYKKLESLYPIRKSDSSDESNQSATSTLSSKKLVYIQINKNTGNILGLRPVRTSTDKKVISNTEPCKATSVIDSVNGQRRSESVNVTSTMSGFDNTTNPRIEKTVSEETISSTDSRVNEYYDMEINIFEDLPCEYDRVRSSVQKNQNLVKNPNELIVPAGRIIRNPAPGECTDEYSVIKPTRTYRRKTNPPESSCTVSLKTESNVKLESLDLSNDSGLEMIASQLLFSSPVASTSFSSASDDVVQTADSPNCILDFLVDDIKTEMEENTSMPPTNILDPIYETVPVNKEDVNITTHSFSTISEADSVWCTIKRIMSILESPIVLDDSEFACRTVVVKTKNTQTDANITSTTACSAECDLQIKQELIEMNETIKQEWITDSDNWDNYPEMVFDSEKIKQEIAILENNTITSTYFDEQHLDPVLPVQLPNENVPTQVNMSRKLKAVVAENRLSINHLQPVTETEYATEQIIKTEYSDGTELE